MILSAKTREVCRAFWRTRPVKGADGKVRQQPTDACCKGCPIQRECHVRVGGTQAEHDAHRARLNAAADLVTL